MDTQDLNWWSERLSSPTVTPLTRDYPDPTQESISKTKIVGVEVVQAESNGLKKLCKQYDSSLVLLTAFTILTARLTGDEDISVGTNIGVDGVPVVARISLTASEPFDELLAKVKDALDDAGKHPVDLNRLREKVGVATLFRFAIYNSMNPGATTYATNDTVDLILDFRASENGSLQLAARYYGHLFSSARIAGILSQILQLIDNVSLNQSASVGAIEFVTPEQRNILPDPTSDLAWSSFRGAIHDIFAANAERHPDRLCVIETPADHTPQREFTYRHIHEASNVLAHHLLDAGLERGDVVMIYSYRGVDLVVAVMGTLKAGGTFSVLDPAYPPDRQNIYLEVAKPRALVVIDKATQEAGPLDPKVRTFIKENLQLKTEVPALRLQDDGTLTGSSSGSTDILETMRERGTKHPGVVVGPDSTPTLSFTSGSEGKPKGVRGRHFSLAYYFDWMAQTFNLSDKDRFTMLSGIAHDPIQRDMFTPLFLGAQLLVPSRNDIQNEKLAEWMRAYGATVTHLTPAMGQILVGGATAEFPQLHHAFFVGDILIKRDCRSLQTLAENVNIVNMYGTTETQRAVSYYELPSRNKSPAFLTQMKDVIPAGRGMYNVQLLVVNRSDRTKICAVGEIGEIYVRAGGLAEGYLGTPELSATKFVQNWFPGSEAGIKTDLERFEKVKHEPWARYYHGPRDRLYRSGDLGRYTPTGDVECSGRADDQVKIRGFRIELGEIDTHLSQHPRVLENVTLVRRDKFEEQILVSYVRPKLDEWKKFLDERGLQDDESDNSLSGRFERFRLLQQDLKEYLSKKLPVYAVPSIIVPMDRMPLNPNGKIDKPKLPFPDASLLSNQRARRSSVRHARTATEMQLAPIWAGLLCARDEDPALLAKTIKSTDSFFDLGANSLQMSRLSYSIRKSLGVEVPITELYQHPTLGEIAAMIDQRRGTETFSGSQPTAPTNGTQSGPQYGEDAHVLTQMLPTSFEHCSGGSTSPKVFLTGATGYLGCFILRDLLNRSNPQIEKVYVLIRAKDKASALQRLRRTCQAYGVWSESWTERIECVVGSLGPAQFGLPDDQWQSLGDNTDVVIHNGAQVHWIDTYATLKAPNVLGTIEAIKLCAQGKAKLFTFVSSTSVLDNDHYVAESARRIAAGEEGIPEDDDLMGSSTGLGTGYGQSKWVAEYLTRECGRRGLRGCVVRPGYILGDSKTGVTNTDDFLIRMLKGCVQLQTRPNINNTVNMVPVDHVARTVVACAFHPAVDRGVCVAQITGHPRLRFNQYLAALETYGYTARLVDYVPWAASLDDYVASKDDFALMPLLTFVTNDLPSNTLAPELDDSNAEASLYLDAIWTGEDVSAGSGVTKNTIGLYLAYLTAIGFLPSPSSRESHAGHQRTVSSAKMLPRVEVSEEQRQALLQVGGRGAIA